MGIEEAAGAVAPPAAPRGRPGTALGLAIRKFGNRVPVGVIHACNVVTRERFRRLEARMRQAELERAAEAQRRIRDDRRALQADMREWWGEVMGE